MTGPGGVSAASLTPLHVMLPMRSVSGGKARLGEAIDAEEREELVLGLLVHTLTVLADWPPCQRIHVVSPDPVVHSVARSRGSAIAPHAQLDEGLNAGVRIGIEAARAEGASSLLILPGDLPYVSTDALDELVLAADAALAAAAGGPLVAIVPSDARAGTNALLLRPVDVIDPAFGGDSLAAHLRAADAAGAAVQVVSHPVLGFDLDTPEDLERLDPTRLHELTALGREAADGVGV